jgi:hypothetical protein
MESDTDTFAQSDLFQIVQALKRQKKQVQEARQLFESQDPELVGFVRPNVAENIATDVFGLDRHEALTIVRRWTEKDKFDYFSFMSTLA